MDLGSTFLIQITFYMLVFFGWIVDKRPSSLVEKEDVENATLNPEILQSLSQDNHSTERIARMPLSAEEDFCTTTSSTTAFSNAEDPKCSQPPVQVYDTRSFRRPKNAKGTSVLTAMNKKSFSMVSKTDKYVTELAFLNPFSYDKIYMMHLGLYIATYYHYGDHIVYKVSPLSPFYAVNLRNQDRLLKINGFDVTCWSHSTLVNFFLHLPHNDQNRFDEEENITKFTISIEFLKQRQSLGSPYERPKRMVASLNFIMEENGRISVASTSVNAVSVTYLNRTSCSLLKLGSSTNRYVKIEEVNIDQGTSNSSDINQGSSNSTDRGTVFRVTEGERLLGETNAEITLHEFDISPRNEPGKIVAMETSEGVFLHAGNSTAGTSLSLISNTNSSNIQNITSNESRLFRIFSSEGNILSKIIHLQSGLYLKAENGTVSLAESPVTNSMMFRIFQC